MVFVRDLKAEFFNCIVPNRVVIFAALDLDSICATKILQNLFFIEGIFYSIVPVQCLEEIEAKFLEYSRGVKNFVFINCGATVDLVEILQPPEGVVFHICDSHRPIDVSNIYNAVQIKLLVKQDESTANIPQFDDVYRDDDADENIDPDSEEEGVDIVAVKRKRDAKRAWEERRQEILFKYGEFTFLARPAALTCLELAYQMARDSNESVFLGLVSLTSGFLLGNISRETYQSEMKSLQPQIARHNRRPSSDPTQKTSATYVPGNQMRLSFRQDIALDLYRQWTLYDSLMRSQTTACHFRVWTAKGLNRMKEFLADCGISLVRGQQRFASAPTELRHNVLKCFEEKLEKYGIDTNAIIVPVYWLSMGFLYDLSISDIGLCALGLLEPGNCGSIQPAAASAAATTTLRSTVHSCFARVTDSLGLKQNIDSLLSDGGLLAVQQLRGLSDAAWSLVQARSIARIGPLLFTTLPQLRAQAPLIVQPLTFCRFARYVQSAFCSDVKNARARSLPFLVLATYPLDESLLVACGLQPLAVFTGELPTSGPGGNLQNCFGKAFEQAAMLSKSRVKPWTFDSNLALIRRDDKQKFLDALVQILSA